jgi:hypothetical protein
MRIFIGSNGRVCTVRERTGSADGIKGLHVLMTTRQHLIAVVETIPNYDWLWGLLSAFGYRTDFASGQQF